MSLTRIFSWLKGKPLLKRRVSHFAALTLASLVKALQAEKLTIVYRCIVYDILFNAG